MFAVLHIADFPLHAVLRTEPEAAGKPAALFATTSKKSVLLAANPAARDRGVTPGMTAPQAVARCADLIIRTPSASAEAEARAALLAVGFTLSPAIEDTAPGVCTADLRHHQTPATPLARSALDALVALALPATAGIGRTPLLALYAARAGTPHQPSFGQEGSGDRPDRHLPGHGDGDRRRYLKDASSPPSQSEVAPDSNSDDELGLFEAPAAYGSAALDDDTRRALVVVADESAFLSPLPLAAADPSPELAAVLHAWGLRTLGDLTALPRDEIVRRFGAAGLALWNRAAGGEPRPLHLVAPAQSFAAAMEFEEEIETLEPLLFILRRFLDRLALELRAAQFVAAEIELTLRLEDETRYTRQFRLPEPTADVEILFRALHTHLESLRTAAAIKALELRLVPARPLVRQQGLFDTGLRDPHGFAETLARVSALVNPDRVGTPQRENTHRPDAVKLVPPADVVPPPAPPPVHPVLGLPLRRFRPPLPATLEFTQPERKPTFVHTERFADSIADVRGPWRSSGEWWQNDRTWARTEWDISLAGGGVYRLLQVGEAFFIEGEYD